MDPDDPAALLALAFSPASDPSSLATYTLPYTSSSATPSASLVPTSVSTDTISLQLNLFSSSFATMAASIYVFKDPDTTTPIASEFFLHPASSSPLYYDIQFPVYAPGDSLTIAYRFTTSISSHPPPNSALPYSLLTLSVPETPDQPTNLTPTLFNATVTALSFTVPPAPPSAPISSIRVTYSYTSQSNQFPASDKSTLDFSTTPAFPSFPLSIPTPPSSDVTLSVAVFNSNGKSPESDSVFFSTPCAPGVPSTPDPPVVDPVVSASLTTTWSPPLDSGCPLTAFTLEISGPHNADTPPSDPSTLVYTTLVSSLPPATTSYTSDPITSPLTSSSLYYLRLIAANANGPSSPSPPTPVSTPRTPDSPTSLTATPLSPRQITLTWSPPPPTPSPLTSYTLTTTPTSSSSSDSVFDVFISAPASEYVVSNLTSQESYSFSLLASNNLGSSAPASASATTPAGCFPVCVSGQGTCSVSAPFVCSCVSSFAGSDCSIPCACVNGVCFEGSSGDGSCLPSSCTSGYQGSLCDTPVPITPASCTGCSPPITTTSASSLTLTGTGFDANIVAYLDATPLPTTYTQLSTRHHPRHHPILSVRALPINGDAASQSPTGSLTITLPSPPPPTSTTTTPSYANLTLVHAITSQTYQSNSVVYFTDSTCTPEAEVDVGGVCVSCPTGAYCPGGARMWPRSGYWLPSEDSGPSSLVTCDVVEACPGALGEQSQYPPQSQSSGPRVTAVCASGEGYTGRACTECLDGFYRDIDVCRTCGLTDADRAEFYLLAGVVFVFIALISASVAFFSSKWLDRSVTILLGLQQIVFVGRLSSAVISGPTGDSLSSFFRGLSFLLFDVEVTKPACTVGKISFATLFFATGLVILFAAALFTVGAIVFALFQARKNPNLVIRRMMWVRAGHSYLLLGSIAYLHVNVRLAEALHCEKDSDGVWRLQIEPDTECYTASHIHVAITAIAVGAIYSLAFPIYMFWMVARANANGITERQRHLYGYLIRGVKEAFYWFRFVSFPITLALAVQTTLANSPELKVFTAMVSFAVNTLVVGVFWPFKEAYSNWMAQFVGIATSIQIFFIRDQLSSSLQISALVIVGVVYTAVIAFRSRGVIYYARSHPKKCRVRTLYALCCCCFSCLWAKRCVYGAQASDDDDHDNGSKGSHSDDDESPVDQNALEELIGEDTRSARQANFFDADFVQLPVVPTKVIAAKKKEIKKRRKKRRKRRLATAKGDPEHDPYSSSAFPSYSSALLASLTTSSVDEYSSDQYGYDDPYGYGYGYGYDDDDDDDDDDDEEDSIVELENIISDASSLVDRLDHVYETDLITAKRRVDTLKSRMRSIKSRSRKR